MQRLIPRLCLSISLAAVVMIPPVQAAEPKAKPNRTLSLQDCVRQALGQNLDIKIAGYSPEAALYSLRADYAAYEPLFSARAGWSANTQPPGFDPVYGVYPGSESQSESASGGISGLLPWGMTYALNANLNDQEGNTSAIVGTNLVRFPFQNTVGQMGAVTLTQPLLRGFSIDGPRLQIALGKTDLRISEEALRAQILTTVAAVETAYYNLIYAYDQVNVYVAAVELAQRTLDENRKRVEVGAMAKLDEKQAEADVAGRKADLLEAQMSLVTAQNLLKGLITDNFGEWHAVNIVPADRLVAVPVVLDLQDSWTRGLLSRPELVQARLTIEKQNTTLKFQKDQILPQLGVFGSAGYNGSTAGSVGGVVEQWANRDAPFYSIGAQFSMPIGNGAARNNYRAARTSKDQLELSLKRMEQNTMVEIDNAINQVRTSFERVGATREARVYSQAALDAEQKKLESGKSTSFVVLRLQKDLTSAKSMEIRALADYNIAQAILSLREGTTLERNKVRWTGSPSSAGTH